jgi:hypothetical protein
MADGARDLAGRVKSIGSVTSAAVLLVAVLATIRCRKPMDSDVKPSWLQTILASASLVCTILALFRPHEKDQQNKQPNLHA